MYSEAIRMKHWFERGYILSGILHLFAITQKFYETLVETFHTFSEEFSSAVEYQKTRKYLNKKEPCLKMG